MAPKRRSTKLSQNQMGTGFFGDAWNFIKRNKIISTGLGFLPGPYGAIGGTIASQLGVGRKPKRKTKQRGKGNPVMLLR